MGPDVLRRVRWGNVALTAAVLAALAAAIAWPRLAPAPSKLPPDAAAPLVERGGAPPGDEGRGSERAERSGSGRRGGSAGGKPAGKSRRGKPRARRGGGKHRTSR